MLFVTPITIVFSPFLPLPIPWNTPFHVVCGWDWSHTVQKIDYGLTYANLCILFPGCTYSFEFSWMTCFRTMKDPRIWLCAIGSAIFFPCRSFRVRMWGLKQRPPFSPESEAWAVASVWGTESGGEGNPMAGRAQRQKMMRHRGPWWKCVSCCMKKLLWKPTLTLGGLLKPRDRL